MFQHDFDGKQIEQSLPNYRYVSSLGSGAFATVHLVANRQTNEQIALKKIKCFGLDEYEKGCAVNEVRILGSLEHPNIIKVDSCLFDSNEEVLYIFMEYADGGDLTVLLDQYKQRKQWIPEPLIWKIIGDLADGLDYLHRNHILHRDLKPANVFKSKGVYKIGDMNVSKILKNETFAKTKTGSPLYTSPEVWDDSTYNEKCDIWSLGIMIYQLCCFRPPFEADSIDELLKTIKATIIRGIPSVYSASLFVLLRQMLELSPKKRISAQEIYKIAHEKLKISAQSHNEEVQSMMDTIVFPQTDKRWVNLIPFPPKPKKNEEKMGRKKEKQNKKQSIIDSKSSRVSLSEKKTFENGRSRSKTRGDGEYKGLRIKLPSILHTQQSEKRIFSKNSKFDTPFYERKQKSTCKLRKKKQTKGRKQKTSSVRKLQSKPFASYH